jgi:hypothetical protein
MLSPSCYYGWWVFFSEILPIETLARLTEQRGQWEKHLQLLAFPIQKSGGKCIWNIKPEISNLPEDPTLIPGECGHHYFCDLYFAMLSESSRCRPKWYGEYCKWSNQSHKNSKTRRWYPLKCSWSKRQILTNSYESVGICAFAEWKSAMLL